MCEMSPRSLLTVMCNLTIHFVCSLYSIIFHNLLLVDVLYINIESSKCDQTHHCKMYVSERCNLWYLCSFIFLYIYDA